MEHLNRVVKTAFYELGANKTKQAITRIGRCVSKIVTVQGNFDRLGVSEMSGSHSKRSFLKDLSKIVDQLKDVNVFSTSHSHRSFSKMKPNLMNTIFARPEKMDNRELSKTILDKIISTIIVCCFFITHFTLYIIYFLSSRWLSFYIFLMFLATKSGIINFTIMYLLYPTFMIVNQKR